MSMNFTPEFIEGFTKECFAQGLHEKQAHTLLSMYICKQHDNGSMQKSATMTGMLTGGGLGAALGAAAGTAAGVDPSAAALLAGVPSAVLGAIIANNRQDAKRTAVDTLDRVQNPDKYKALGPQSSGFGMDPALRNAGMSRLLGMGNGVTAAAALGGARRDNMRNDVKSVVLGNEEPSFMLDHGGLLGALTYGGTAASAAAGLGAIMNKGKDAKLPIALAILAGTPAALYGGLKADARSMARKVVDERGKKEDEKKDK